MRKNLLLMFLAVFVGMFTAKATTSVIINVDKAANVTVQTNYGYGETLQLTDGMNKLDLDDGADSPLIIKANPGAEIVSVTKNESETINPGGDGSYTVRFYTAGIKIDIVTTGEGQGGTVAKDITMDFFASGEGISGKPFTVTYEKDSEWVTPEKGSMGYMLIPENAKVKITPDKAYKITGCSVPNSSVTLNGSVQEDGSYVFDNNVPDYYRVQVNMELDASAIRFSLTVDYAPNVSCFLENQREGEWEYLTVYDNVKTNFVIVDSQNPLEFIPAEGAEILQVLKNGEPQIATGWGGSNGWVFVVENGDEFTVTTKGAPTTVAIEAPEGNAPLDAYFFTKADGTSVPLSGMSADFEGNLGETVVVKARPGSTLSYIMSSNGGYTNMLDNFRIVAGADKTNPAKYQIYGTRNVNGVVINVDNAQRVSVTQEGGRGEALQLQNGKNEFAFADIKNALAIDATEGNQMVAVSVNGDNVNVSSNGHYMVEAAEGDWIEITSRPNPVDATLSFTFNEGADLSWLAATSEGQSVKLANPMTVKSYTTLMITAADGYILENLTCDTEGVTVTKAEKGYEVYIASASVTAATISATLKEIQATEGNSIVVANGDELLVRFWEMTGKEGTFVKKLENNRVNEVKSGNWVQVFCKDTQSEFAYVKVNGADIELISNEEGLKRTAWVEVNGRTVIDTKVVTPCQATTTPTYDEVKHIQSGNVYIEIDGQKYTNVTVSEGQTVKLVAEPATGYVFDHFEKFYSLTMAADGIVLDGDTYTFTESDVAENFILFKGVFKEDENAKVYAIRGSSAWIVDENNQLVPGTTAMGNVVIQLADGSYSRETTALEGQTVKLQIQVFDQETVDKYEVAGFCLMSGFPDAAIPANYEVSAKDADAEGVIWISGLMREKGSAVDSAMADTDLSYNRLNMAVTAAAPVRIYNINGQLLISAEAGEVSVETLPQGVYMAVSGNKQIKFVK